MKTQPNTTMEDEGQGGMFPVLEPVRLVEVLQELKINVTMQDIAEPNPRAVREVYMRFVETLTELTWEQINQPQLHAMEALTFPELFQDALPPIMFCHAL
jgi:hypothetical protein